MNTEKVYNNRAYTSGDIVDCTDYECCHEELVFAMQDKTHQFSLGLSTLLECLMIAEKEGYVPALLPEWWQKIRQH